MKAPLRAYLLLLVVAPVIPLIGTLGFNVVRDAQHTLAQARAAQRPLLAAIAADASRKIASTHETLRLLAERPRVQAMDPQQCDGVLADLHTLTPDYSNIVSTDRAGHTVCSAIPLPAQPPSVGATDWFRKFMAEERFSVGPPHIGPITGRWVSVLSMPVRNPEGEMVGAVHLPLNLQAFRPNLGTQELPAGSRYGIMGADGTLIWRNDAPGNLTGTRPEWATADRIAEMRGGEFTLTGADGVARYYATLPIPQTDWVAFFGVPSTPITEYTRNKALANTGLGLLIILGVVWFALALARRIERPIGSLTQAVHHFSEGGESVLAEPSGPRELVRLATGFNTMVADRLRVEAVLGAQRQQLQRAKDRIDLAMQIAQMGMWCWDLRTGLVHSDEILAQLFGHSPESLAEVPIATWRAWTHSDDLPALDLSLRACLKGATQQFEATQRIRHRDGHWIWGQWRGRVTERDAQGRAVTLMGSFHDITERMQSHDRLKLAASVFTHAREGIVITDPRGTIIDVNETFTRITGYTREEALGNNPRMLQSGRQSPEFYASLWRTLLAQGHWTGELWNRRKDGSLFAEIITISAVHSASGEVQHYVSLFTDITEIKEHERKLEHIAHYDALTGLPNRVLLADRLQQSMLRCQRTGQSLAVAFLDLDGFKGVNDHHGHERGDQLLVALAQRLKAALREGDTLSRIGGDEFVAVLVDLDHAQGYEPVLARMLHSVAEPVKLGDTLLQVSASIGVTLYPADGVAPDLLIRHADQAMYQAKQAGKNRLHLFDVAHDAAVKTQREEIDRLRRALAHGEFVLHYQPKVNMRTGQVIGAEALIRWLHPERGLLHPACFLPATAGHAVCIEVGEWVLATALGQMAQWQAQGLDLSVSVNVDALQLQTEGFVERLAQLLAAQPDVRPERLELEILETSALEDIGHVSAIMHRCQALGVRFALDDFGTGYSSLTYLKRLNAEAIKIDQSFVRDMQSDPDDLAIVKGVIGLADAFHRQVIAEGVETIEHGSLLIPLGCELAQGYGIARPMPAGQLPGWVRGWTPDRCWSGIDGEDAHARI